MKTLKDDLLELLSAGNAEDACKVIEQHRREQHEATMKYLNTKCSTNFGIDFESTQEGK